MLQITLYNGLISGTQYMYIYSNSLAHQEKRMTEEKELSFDTTSEQKHSVQRCSNIQDSGEVKFNGTVMSVVTMKT